MMRIMDLVRFGVSLWSSGYVTTETIDLGQKTLSRVREVGSVRYLNKQNASCEVLSEIEQIRDCELRTS